MEQSARACVQQCLSPRVCAPRVKVVGSLAAAVEHSEARKGGAHAGVSEDAAVKPVRHNARWEKREEGRGGGGMSL